MPIYNLNGVRPSHAVSRDRTRPMLTHARIIEINGELELQATDGFRLLRSRVTAHDSPGGDTLSEPIMLDTPTLRAVERAGYFMLDGLNVVPCDSRGTPVGPLFLARPYNPRTGWFPEVQELGRPSDPAATRVKLNARLLLQLARAIGSDVLTIELGDSRQPLLVTAGGDALVEALLMPVFSPRDSAPEPEAVAAELRRV